LLSSCSAIIGTTPQKPGIFEVQSPSLKKEGDAETILTFLKKTNCQLKSFKGTGTLRFYNNGINQSTRIAWAGLFPDKIRMEILSTAGQPYISIAGNGKKVYFLFHHNKKFYKKSFNADLNKIISIPVKITHIIELLSGRIPVSEYTNVFLLTKNRRSDVSTLVLEKKSWGKKNGKTVEKIFFDPKTKIVQHIEFINSKGSVEYSAAFDEIQKIKDYNIPAGFLISDNDASVHLDIDKYWADVPIELSIFELTQ